MGATDLPGDGPAEALADERDRAVGTIREAGHVGSDGGDQAAEVAVVDPQAPAARRVAEQLQVGPERHGAQVVRAPAREHEHRDAGPAWPPGQRRSMPGQPRELEEPGELTEHRRGGRGRSLHARPFPAQPASIPTEGAAGQIDQSRPNQRWMRERPNSTLSAAFSREAATIDPWGASPLTKVTSTLATSSWPNSR